MSTQAQIEANRKNAQKSTGPKTPQGKLIASKNSTTHVSPPIMSSLTTRTVKNSTASAPKC